MSERRITRRPGEAIRIEGPATIRVNRRVTLIVEAPREARVERVDDRTRPGSDTAVHRTDLPLATNRPLSAS
jgi:hypothetical protein